MLIVGAASACSALVFIAMPTELIWQSMRVAAVGLVLLFLFVWASSPTRRSKTTFVIWWLVLVSGYIFFRSGDLSANADALEGKFPAAVYSEVLAWSLYLIAVLIFWVPVRQYFGRLFAGDYKWLTLFAIVCVASCIYAPRSLFALAWAFKLSVVVLLLVLCSTQIHHLRDTVSFLRFTFWAYTLVVLVPVVLGFLSGSPFDDEGRMSTIVNPDALSADAAAVSVLALTLFSRVKGEGLRKSAIFVGSAAFVVAILAGGKVGIVGGIFAGVLFLIVRRRFGSALGYVGIAILLACVLALSTPLGSYLSNYKQSGSAATLTGRTLLWSAVMPAIWHQPILGHGYLASTFVQFQVNGVDWPAPQLHNGFVEVLYNNGLIGLIPILVINFVIARNLIQVLRRAPSTGAIYRLGAGCLALYAHLFLNGLFNASFGGRVRPPFILLLSLVLVSNKLLELLPRPQLTTPYTT
jgi:O-antigen ligase